MAAQHIDLPQGTLDLLVLRTLALGPLHGWAISERVQQLSSDVLRIQQGSLYPALHRLERRGLIKARWGTSENNRRAKYYELSKAGHQQLEVETDAWEKLTAAVAQVPCAGPQQVPSLKRASRWAAQRSTVNAAASRRPAPAAARTRCDPRNLRPRGDCPR